MIANESDAPEGARPPEPPPGRTWRCLTCQFVLARDYLPMRCPRCGASRVKFVEAEAVAAEPGDEPEEE